MSDPTVNPKLDQVWSPADYDETVRDAGRHRAERGTLDDDETRRRQRDEYQAQTALYAKGFSPDYVSKMITQDGTVHDFGTAAHEALIEAGKDDAEILAELRAKLHGAPQSVQQETGATWIPIHTVEAEQAKQIRDELGIDDTPPRLPAEKMTPDVEPFLPFRRKPGTVCQCCAAWPDEKCERGCLSTMTDEQQRLHRDTVLDQILAELDITDEPHTPLPYPVPGLAGYTAEQRDELARLRDEWGGESYRVICEVGPGRHRPPVDRWRRYRRLRAVLVVAAAVLVLALGALWASHEAKAENFTVCPSGSTGVASADTSCAFAEAVRTSFYWNPSWTVFAKSPVTGKYYTMQCSRTDTTGTGWSDSKRCFGLSDGGDALIVYIA